MITIRLTWANGGQTSWTDREIVTHARDLLHDLRTPDLGAIDLTWERDFDKPDRRTHRRVADWADHLRDDRRIT